MMLTRMKYSQSNDQPRDPYAIAPPAAGRQLSYQAPSHGRWVEDCRIYIADTSIAAVYPEDGVSVILCNNGNNFYVRETPEEINNMIRDSQRGRQRTAAVLS